MKHNNQPPFHAFTIKHSGLVNRITTPVRLAKAFDPKTFQGEVVFFEMMALWDTGATKSVVTKATAEAIGLVPTGNTVVAHAGGSSVSNTYLINVYLPNNVGVAGVLVSECPDIAGNFGAIIGMDIIGGGDLSITNVNNQTWMTFRLPSFKTIDYVVRVK